MSEQDTILQDLQRAHELLDLVRDKLRSELTMPEWLQEELAALQMEIFNIMEELLRIQEEITEE
jgi:hypothetical protein